MLAPNASIVPGGHKMSQHRNVAKKPALCMVPHKSEPDTGSPGQGERRRSQAPALLPHASAYRTTRCVED
jgi:hypothetical protein